VKFTERGEIRLSVTAAGIAPPGRGERLLEISVTDSGIGIPPKRLSGIFDAFTQADASTTRRFGGTGLGLSICRELVRLMGGEIWAESSPGEGSTFHFTLCLPVTDADTESTFARLRGRRLLALGDSATSRQLLNGLRHQLGVASVKCESASALQGDLLDAVDQNEAVDALLLDTSDRGAEILGLARRLRAQHVSVPPMIRLSPLGNEDSDGELFDLTFARPVRPRLLANALLQCVGERGGPRSDLHSIGRDSTRSATLEQPPVRQMPARRFDLRVLVAEDNPVNQRVAQGLLSKLGIEADLAENGREAVQKIAAQYFDVVLMDVQMPEVDGLEATRLIRDTDLPQPHIIAMTANAMKEDRERCLEVGMDDFLAKPIRLEGLVDVLDRLAPR
jgi:CheY-like chemotaxis protein